LSKGTDYWFVFVHFLTSACQYFKSYQHWFSGTSLSAQRKKKNVTFILQLTPKENTTCSFVMHPRLPEKHKLKIENGLLYD